MHLPIARASTPVRCSAIACVRAQSDFSSVTRFSLELMRHRYTRAVQWTAPKVAARTAGINLDGYWLDSDSYYFLAESFEPALGQVVTTPSIAHCESQRIEELI